MPNDTKTRCESCGAGTPRAPDLHICVCHEDSVGRALDEAFRRKHGLDNALGRILDSGRGK